MIYGFRWESEAGSGSGVPDGFIVGKLNTSTSIDNRSKILATI